MMDGKVVEISEKPGFIVKNHCGSFSLVCKLRESSSGLWEYVYNVEHGEMFPGIDIVKVPTRLEITFRANHQNFLTAALNDLREFAD